MKAVEKMQKFPEVFSELFRASGLTTTQLGEKVGVTASCVSLWLCGKRKIGLGNALKLCEIFECALEFLLGRSDLQLDFSPKPVLPFCQRLRQVLATKNVSWYRICIDLKKSNRHLYRWESGCDPYLETVVEFADYFKMTVDEFVGRE